MHRSAAAVDVDRAATRPVNALSAATPAPSLNDLKDVIGHSTEGAQRDRGRTIARMDNARRPPATPSLLAARLRADAWAMLLALLAALCPWRAGWASDLPSPGLVLAHASFQLAGGVPRDVDLPHTWALSGLPNGGAGHYRLEFDLDRVPDADWSLGADRISSHCAMRINGSFIHGALPMPVTKFGAAPVAALFDLPSALLRPGRNVVEIDVEFAARGGMSPLRIGPTGWVREAYARTETLGFTVPQSLNVGAVVLALFMLSIWVRRRSETELGTLGALMVVASTRNIVSTGVGGDWHGVLVDYGIFMGQVASVVLLAWFSLAFSRRNWPAFRRMVNVVGIALAVLGALARWQGDTFSLRLWTYPLLLALLLPSVWLILVGARASRGLRRAALTLAILMIVAAAVHDYFFLRGLVSVMDRYWLPFASPLMLLIFAMALLDRFVGALAAVEAQAGELERKVAERTRELEVANAAKTRFLAAASHDLRQPVVSISLLSELLREQPLPASSHRILARMGDSVQALSGLLKSLLDLSRFDAGAVTARKSSIALRPLLERVAGDEAESARRLGISLRVRAAGLSVHSDPILLEQILRNLVGNAVRYTRYGGVLMSARPRGDDLVLLQVWDTGPGIPSESQSRVFDEFVQLDNAARESACGLGLGLSLVRRAAQVLDARVTLRSVVGKGSCFSIEVPLAVLAVVPHERELADGAGFEGRTLWVVEDDPDVLEALRLRLTGWGAQVRTFGDLDSFRRALGDGRPDVVVADQRLPDGNGVDVARLLQAVDAHVPLLIVTGDTSPDDIALLRASSLPVLHKPFTSDELRSALSALGGDRGEAS